MNVIPPISRPHPLPQYLQLGLHLSQLGRGVGCSVVRLWRVGGYFMPEPIPQANRWDCGVVVRRW